jgi:predicted NBD/HSP70 family sugar kinase/putative N-acetylmannosamine-6-phosphate epimerase
MTRIPDICRQFQNRLIVSCQGLEGEAFRGSDFMARFAQAAVAGGAAAIRADGAEDVAAIRKVVRVPILGIRKSVAADGRVLITGSFEAAKELVAAGADIIALDCTARGQRYGALERLERIRREVAALVMADVATVEEAVSAAAAGADIVASTMRGYTAETESVTEFEPGFIAELARAVDVPVIAEGRIHTPDEAASALAAGAFAVVVGRAITHPQSTTERFARALEAQAKLLDPSLRVIGIDLGGTNTKFGIVDRSGKLAWNAALPTPASGGRGALLDHLKEIAAQCMRAGGEAGAAPAALGIATAGWVDPHSGVVVYATENLPGWTGTQLKRELGEALHIPVAVENDANALAVAEKAFGRARHADTFVCITLGTGVGGGCYTHGRLHRGAHFFANGIGHIQLDASGPLCTCGQRGCLETYTNAAALMRCAAGCGFATPEEVIRAANAGDAPAGTALREYARYLARGCASIIHLLDPEMIVFSGGLAQDNPQLLADLSDELSRHVMAWDLRGLKIEASTLGYYGGVLGAAALAFDALAEPA